MKILEGDCVAAMSQMVQESVDSIVTDPPYHFASIVKRFGAVYGVTRATINAVKARRTWRHVQ